MVNSVKVEAADEKEALEKGYKLLEEKEEQLKKDILYVKLIEENKKIFGIFGRKKNEYRVGIPDESQLDEDLQDVTEDISVDGDFKLKIHPEGIFLKVFSPEGSGKKVGLSDVEKALNKKKIEDIDREKLEKMIRDPEGKWIIIAPRKPELDQDAQVNVELDSDYFRAYLDYEPAFGGKEISLGRLKDSLKEAGVIYGIKEDKVKEIVEHRVRQKEVLIAEGDKPKPPKDEKLVYNFEDKKESIGTEREDGSIDFHDRGLITNVSPGSTLVTIKKGEPGEPGYKVTGDKITPPKPRTVELPSGKNVKKTDDGVLVSEIEGQVVKDGRKVNVLPIHEVNGSVDINTGNIDFVGNVIIKGDVEEGFQIEAGGNVEVRGHVSAAQIESGGEVVIKKGFVGKEKGKIFAEGDVKIKFIENGYVKTEGSIIVSDAVMHSRLNAGEDIIVKEAKGLLVGGKCQANHHIEANIIGSSMATKTILEAGVDQEAKERLNEIEEELKNSEQSLLKIKKALKTLNKLREKYGKLPNDKEIMYQRLVKTRKKIEQSIDKMEREEEELEEKLENIKKGKIKVGEKIFSGVKMIISGAQYNVHNQLQHSSFIEESGEVRQIPL